MLLYNNMLQLFIISFVIKKVLTNFVYEIVTKYEIEIFFSVVY